MAGLSDVKAGMNLDPQTLAKILAMRKGQGTASGGGQVWYDSNLKTDDPNAYIVHNYAGQRWEGGDAGLSVADPSLDQNFITKLRPDTGGKLGDQWDLDGNYRGTIELNSGGGRDFNQAVALIAGGYLGGSYATGTGPFSGAASAGGGLQSGGLMEAMGGTTPVGGGATAAGGGLQAGGLTEALGGATPVGGASTATAAGGGVTATQAVNGASTASKVADAVKTTGTVANGWEQLAKITGGAVVSGLVGDALADPVDTSKFDQLFTNLLTEQQRTSARSQDLWDNYLTSFKPLQEQFAKTAAGFDTPTRRETAANDATGQVAASFDQQRMTAGRNLTMAGVDPSTIAALDSSSRIIQAKDEANAANAARADVEKTGLSLVKSAADMGSGLVSAANQSSQVATGTTQAASGVLTTQGNLQNANTQNRNELVGDLFGAGLKLYGMYGGGK